jgi:hypothetical protein
MNLLPTDFYFFSSLFLCCCSQSTAGGQQAIYCRHGFGRTHSGLCFYHYSFLYLFVKELYCSVVWSPLGRASISASYSIFFGNLNLQLLTQFWPWQPSQHQNYCHYFLKNHLISTAKNWGGVLFLVRGARRFPPQLSKLDFADAANHKRWTLFYQKKTGHYSPYRVIGKSTHFYELVIPQWTWTFLYPTLWAHPTHPTPPGL